MAEITAQHDPMNTAITRAGRELAELARRRLARQIRIGYPTATALQIEPIDTGGHSILSVLNACGMALTTSDEEDLDWGSEAMTDLITVERYSGVRPDPDGPLTITLGPVPGAAGNEQEKAAAEVVVVSFGHLHGSPPPAHVVVDVRELLRDPLTDPALRELTGLDEPVREHVLATAGATALVAGLEQVAGALHGLRPGEPVSIALGCGGGRHRAPALAAELGARLARAGYPTTVAHRHIDRPVVDQQRTTAALLEAAREAAAWRDDRSFSLRDAELEAALGRMARGHAWARVTLRELAETGTLVALGAGRYRVVSAIHRIISGDTYYGGGTDLEEVKERAAEMFRTRNWSGDVFDVKWQRRGEDWSLVAADDDEEPDEQGMVSAWHTGVRIETVDVDDEDGGLDLVVDDEDARAFSVTVTEQDGTATEYPAEGQAGAEAVLALAAPTGNTAVAVLVEQDEDGQVQR
jgi:UPF0042 nucleotide-binding protein